MSFDPSQIAISNITGNYPSNTVISVEDDFIRITSNGDPFPAKAGNPFVNDGTLVREGFGGGNKIQEQFYDFTFWYRGGRISHNPQAVGVGPIGIFANGVVLFSPQADDAPLPGSEAQPPAGLHWNAVHNKKLYGADAAQGHPNAGGVYHYHTGLFLPVTWSQEPKVYNSNEYYNGSSFGRDFMRQANGHSKLIGFAFDGFPIYGPFGYEGASDSSTRVVRMTSSYKLRPDDDHRPNGFKYTDQIIAFDNPITMDAGTFVEDYRYVVNSGSLDEYNGRYCVTPEYPDGTYAYFLTFEDNNLERPAYPYVVGKETKQQRAEGIVDVYDGSLWTLGSGTVLTTMVERISTDVLLPVANGIAPRIELIAGKLPGGMRIEGSKLTGTPFEVDRDTVFTFVLRAIFNRKIEDRTYKIIVTGPDAPNWVTRAGRIAVGANDSYYVLDNALVDFQLLAIDNDLPAGDELEYYIADGDGELPPGLSLSEDGKITGITTPLLSLTAEKSDGGYDTNSYSSNIYDYSVKSTNGFGTYNYDIEDYDYSIPTKSPKKLNRFYPFAVTVTDGDTYVRREFTIYLVGDDFLRSDNTVMQAGTGVFTADNTYLRNPQWLTPSDLGTKRANNYVTLYLDVIQNETLVGEVTYSLEGTNPGTYQINSSGRIINNGYYELSGILPTDPETGKQVSNANAFTVITPETVSELPPGLELDRNTGEVLGRIPYQPAISESYEFTIRAERFEGDLGTATIFATFYEDTLIGAKQFKVGKLDLTGNIDGVDDLNELLFKQIVINNKSYQVIRVDGTNDNYDIIEVDRTITPSISLIVYDNVIPGQDHFFVSRLTESEKEKYNSRNLKFGDEENYQITNIFPYLEYRIKDAASSDIYFNDSSFTIRIGDIYNIGDYAYYDGMWYVLSSGDVVDTLTLNTHEVVVLTDEDGAVVTDANGNPVPNFESSKWSSIAASSTLLDKAVRKAALTQFLERNYPQGNTYITEPREDTWLVRMPATANSRNTDNKIKVLFASGTEVSLIKDNMDRLKVDTPFERSLTAGRNIAITLFRGDFFSKDIQVAEVDEVVDYPFTVKTFNLTVIGEIDTTITWLTDSNLGSINANLTSTFFVKAQTTVPDSQIVYTVVSGKLPNGLRLNRTGEIIGKPRQFQTTEGLGLTTFDNDLDTTFDGQVGYETNTSFDRVYKFTVEARDRFNLSAVTREFSIEVIDLDDTRYSNIYATPLMPESQRSYFKQFVSNPDIFTPNAIYRPDDPEFGLQRQVKILIYGGIETKSIAEYVAAATRHHKKRRFRTGEIKKAVAKIPGTQDVLYEAIYIELIDPRTTDVYGEVAKSFNINNNKKITVDSIQYATKDDETNLGTGISELPIYGREIVKFVIPDGDTLNVYTRDSQIEVNADNEDITIDVREGDDIEIELQVTDSEPFRFRPQTNTIKSDNTAVRVSDSTDRKRYLSNIEHMRDEIAELGAEDRQYLPLWMRTPQSITDFSEKEYVNAIPLAYTKPGEADNILLNIKNSNWDPKKLDITIDRYIVDQTKESSADQYVVFANYQFNA